MNLAIETALSMLDVEVTLAQPGFKGRCAKYRVAWSVRGCGWHPSEDARTRAARRAYNRGLARVGYERGASARDFRVSWGVHDYAMRVLAPKLTGTLAGMAPRYLRGDEG